MAANVWKILLKKSLRFIKYANFDGLQEKYHWNPSFPPLGNEDEPLPKTVKILQLQISDKYNSNG